MEEEEKREEREESEEEEVEKERQEEKEKSWKRLSYNKIGESGVYFGRGENQTLIVEERKNY